MRILTTALALTVLTLFLPKEAASQPIVGPEGIIAMWLFDEPTGDVAADLSGNGNDGTLVNAPQRVEGMFGLGLDFNGVDTCVSTGQGLFNDLEEFTIVAWVKPGANTANRVGLVGQNDAVEFGFIAPGTLQLFTDPPFHLHDVAYPHPEGEWHHVAAVASQSFTRVYLDGVPTEISVEAEPRGSVGTVNIGGCGVFDTDGNWFTGTMDDVAIFNVALTTDDITKLMNEGLRRSILSPVALKLVSSREVDRGVVLPVTVELTRADGNPAVAVDDVVVNLSTDSPGGRFDTSEDGAFDSTVTVLTISAGETSLEFFYRDANVGVATVTASAQDFPFVTRDIQVLPTRLVRIADSLDDWSNTGTQGENNWFNGYYNLTLDADGIYQASDFMPFRNEVGSSGGPVAPDGNHWTGFKWALHQQSPGPWTELQAEGTHPNGTNSAPGEEHWTIRRWVSDRTGVLVATWHLREINLGGTGVSGLLFHNDRMVDMAAVAGADSQGVTHRVLLDVEEGDSIDLAHSPVDPNGNRGDGADGSANRLTVEQDDTVTFRRGDLISDGHVDIGDPFGLSFGLFMSLTTTISCADAADANASGVIDLADAIHILDWLFRGGLEPPAPGPFTCGPNLEVNDLGCSFYLEAVCDEPEARSTDPRFQFVLDGLPDKVEGEPGETVTFDVSVGLCNSLPVAGWSLGVAATGVRIVDATTVGTLAAPEPEGLRRDPNFEYSEVAVGGEHAVSGVLLGLGELTEIPPSGEPQACDLPNPLLLLTIEADIPENGAEVGTLEFVDGLQVSGQPIENLVTSVDGVVRVHQPQLGSHSFTVGSPPCPADPVICEGLQLSGPGNNGPGVYTVTVTSNPARDGTLYSFAAERLTPPTVLETGPRLSNSFDFNLTEGLWEISATVKDGPDCPESACESVNLQVVCIEVPDGVVVNGLSEGKVGETVELLATFLGADPGSQTSYQWDVTSGAGKIVGETDRPLVRVTTSAPGDVTIRVRAGDSICGDPAEGTHTISFSECVVGDGVVCEGIRVTGPEGNAPGEYFAMVVATVPPGEDALYFFRVENAETGQRAEVGPEPFNTARIDLLPGRWIFSASVGTNPDCPFEACAPVEVVVNCIEEADSIEISGSDEADVGDTVELSATFAGADPGATVSYTWELVQGEAEIVGPDDGPALQVRATTSGEVMVRVTAGDGVCADDAQATHTVLFKDCPAIENIVCESFEITGPNQNQEYLGVVTAAVPQGERALYFFRVENPVTGQEANAGPGPSNSVRLTLPAGTWDVFAAVGTDVDCPFLLCEPVRLVIGAEPVEGVGPFVRGDCDGDGDACGGVTDALIILFWAFRGGQQPPCLAACSADGTADVGLTDAVYNLVYCFAGGAPPGPPFPACGFSQSASDTSLGCQSPPEVCQSQGQ